MHGAHNAKITKELENFVKDFGFCRRFILTSNTFTCFFFVFSFSFFFHIVCREKLKHYFKKTSEIRIYKYLHISKPTKNQILMIRYHLWSRHIACHDLGILLEFYLRHTKVLLF